MGFKPSQSCWVGEHLSRKQVCQEDQWPPCCLGLKVILEIRAIIKIEDTFKFNKNSSIKHLFKKCDRHPQQLLQYSPDVRKFQDGQLWFCEEILCYRTCWESMSHQPLGINSPYSSLLPGLPCQKQTLIYVREMLRLITCSYRCWTICLPLSKWQRKPQTELLTLFLHSLHMGKINKGKPTLVLVTLTCITSMSPMMK